MAILDDERRARTDDRPNEHLRERTDGSGMLMLVVGVLIVALLGWWILTNRAVNDTGMTRTSPPVTTTVPNNTAPNTTAPTTAPKQP